MSGPTPDDPAAVAAIVAALAASRKYRHVAPEALARIAGAALRSSQTHADAIKRAKRRLHQVFAAFVTDREIERATRLVDALPPDEAARQQLARALLSLHASTRERAPAQDLAARYAAIFELTGPPRRLLDLGCGFHPFALPWMGLAPTAEYLACDLDARVVALVERFLRASGQPGRAFAWDLAGGAPDLGPDLDVDVALALKLLPTLERQEAGGAARLVATLRARHVVLSFPAGSLGGRGRGMREQHARFARTLLAPRVAAGAGVTTLEMADETIHVVAPGREGWIRPADG